MKRTPLEMQEMAREAVRRIEAEATALREIRKREGESDAYFAQQVDLNNLHLRIELQGDWYLYRNDRPDDPQPRYFRVLLDYDEYADEELVWITGTLIDYVPDRWSLQWHNFDRTSPHEWEPLILSQGEASSVQEFLDSLHFIEL